MLHLIDTFNIINVLSKVHLSDGVTNNTFLELIKFDNSNLCDHSLNTYLLNIYYIHSTISDTGSAMMNETDVIPLFFL